MRHVTLIDAQLCASYHNVIHVGIVCVHVYVWVYIYIYIYSLTYMSHVFLPVSNLKQ